MKSITNKTHTALITVLMIVFLLNISENGQSQNDGATVPWLVEPQFDDADDFHDGMACVKKHGAWGFIKNPLTP